MGSKKNILIVIAIFLIGIVITGASYAYWTINSNVNKNIIFNTANNLKEYVVYDEGESKFSGNFEVTNSYNQGIHSTISLYKKSEVANLTLLATIHMNINSIGANMANSNALKWVVTSGTSSNIGSVLASGNFIGSKNDDVLDLVTNLEVTTTETFYTIWIWLDASANPSDGLSGETLDTNVWTEITQLEGEEDRFEITRVSANYQMIDATVVDSKYKVTNYAITSSNTTPSTWTSITSNDQNYVYNMPSYSASATGTYYVWFKDSANRTTSKSVVVTQIDNTAPSCTWGSWNKQSISNNETATIKITCTDNESELAVNSVTTASITKSNNNITVTDLTKTKITNGYEINITVTGTNNSGETTLTLPVNTVKNSVNLGNQSITSETINVTNTYTATFYYNNNATSGSTTVATKTASCTVSNSAGNCVVTIPTDVTGSVGTYNNAYAGLSSSTGNMTQAVAADTTSVTLSGDATYYSLYRTAVTIYKPSSTSACNTQAFYRNQWFTSTNTMAETVLSTSTTGTTNSEMTLLSGYSFMELRTASATGGNAYKVANAAKTNTTTFYGREQKTSASITFKYSNSNTGTVASTVATGTDILHCTSTSAASYVNGSVSPTVTHTAPYGTTFIGWTSTVGSMNSLTTSLTSASTTWYAVYRTDNVKVYRPSSETACTNDTLYRNAVIGSISATTYTAVLATTNTGVSNFTPTVVSGYSFAELRTAVSDGGTGYTVANAAKTTTTSFYIREGKSQSATFYYYSGSQQSSTTGSGTKTLQCISTSDAGFSHGAITVPAVVTNSNGPNSSPYSGVSIGTSSTSTTTTINTGTTLYYAVYGGTFTATFNKENNNVASIGSSTLSCSSSYTTDGTAYTGTDGTIILPSITPATGYKSIGWYDSDDIWFNYSNAEIILTSNATFTAKAKRLTASDLLYDNRNSGVECDNVQCMIDYLDTDNSISTTSLELGDYVSYTPTKTSYTTSKVMTGYTSTQTINPSELNLWRVIAINGDGTVDLISEDVSSTAVYFRGQTGYQNFVGYLNVLASQYETTGITVGSRHFGYNGQTEFITDTQYFTNPAPWTCSTGDTCTPDPDDYESSGGGDTLYQDDYNLINTILGTRIANKVGTSTATTYLMASRYYRYSSAASYYWNARLVNPGGSSGSATLYDYSSSYFNTSRYSGALRPIVTLKSGLSYTGSGTSASPWVIQ